MKDKKGENNILKKSKEIARKNAARIASLPLKGVGLTLKAIFSPFFKKYPWLKIGLIVFGVIIVLALLGPAAGLISKIIELITAVFKPLIESPVGRFILLNVSLAFLIYIIWISIRKKVIKTIGSYVLSRYLEGLSLLLKGKLNQSAKRFKSALRWGTWLDLSNVVSEFPHIKEDAGIRLAYIALKKKNSNEALRYLLKIKKESLPEDFIPSYLELLAKAYVMHPNLTREAVDQKLEEILNGDPKNPFLLRLIRERKEQKKDWEKAASLQERLIKNMGERVTEEEKKKLALLLIKAGEEEKIRGNLEKAWEYGKKALKVCPDMEHVMVFLGDLAAQSKNFTKAIKYWGESKSLLALERLGAFIEEKRIFDKPLEKDVRNLITRFPYAGILLVLAKFYSDSGEIRKAYNALRILIEKGVHSPRILTLYASLLEKIGKHNQAQIVCRKALYQLIGLPFNGEENKINNKTGLKKEERD